MSADQDTIAALLTPLAPGAIAVIGLAGGRSEAILQGILRRIAQDAPLRLAERRPTLCRLFEGHDLLDDAVVTLIARGPAAHVEISVHGGVRMAQRVLRLLTSAGAVVVDADAFYGRMTTDDPVEQDVDRALRRSPSRRMTNWLLCQRNILPGFLRRLDSLPPAEQDAFRQRSEVASRLVRGLSVAIIGPPNVGKSTLANRLIGSDRIITSDRAGTTRDWVSETAMIDGWPVTLTDTAGVRDSTCAIESEAIRRGGERARRADLVLIVDDVGVTAAQRESNFRRLAESLSEKCARLFVLNKCDTLGDRDDEPRGARACRVSALHGTGMSDLESAIAQELGLDQLDNELPTAFLPDQIPTV